MRAFLAALCVFVTGAAAQAQVPHPPLEAYGELPFVRHMAMSPDGETVAFVIRKDGSDVIATFDIATSAIQPRMSVDNIAARDVWFADSNHLILNVSDTKDLTGYRDTFIYSVSYSLNLETNTSQQLLRATRDIYRAQTGLGRIVGVDDESGQALMPAYILRPSSRSGIAEYNLLKVDLDSGFGRGFKSGSPYTIDWFVAPDGTVLAREEYNDSTNMYRIFSDLSDSRAPIYEVQASRPPISIVGVKPDRSALIYASDAEANEGFEALFELGMDGKSTGPVLARVGADIGRVFTDKNRVVEGVRYAGPIPSYQFYDPALNKDVQDLVDRFAGGAVWIVSHSRDWNRILFSLFDGSGVNKYVVLDRTTGDLIGLMDDRENIPPEAVGSVMVIAYPARDGLTIPAILTLPAGVSPDGLVDLPMVVMPHGGPAAYDSVKFDWMAQYFANRGYLVLQPNFRGSEGYGRDFLHAGYGEWGQKMQDDVSDGVAGMVAEGLVDPERICIVGASYGGYSALAGGAYTPDLYKCVVAVAPVSDLRKMIRDEASTHGSRHWVVDYWKDLIGDPKAPKVDLDAISPVNSAAAFKAPVRLIHGKDDTVVPISQSQVMERALKADGKPVDFIELRGEDHWLSDGDTRIETLRAMSDFVDAHIGGN